MTSLKKTLMEHISEGHIIEMTSDMVRIPSYAGIPNQETGVARYVKNVFDANGIPCYLKEVAGVRTDARITVMNAGEEIAEWGELQLTDYGISGIPVFQLSRKVNYLLRDMGKNAEAEVVIDLFPAFSGEEFTQMCKERKLFLMDRTVEEFFTGMLNKKLMLLFIKLAGLKRDAMVMEVEDWRLQAVYDLCKNWRLHVIGSNPYDNAQVCAGGVDTTQVGINMESALVPGLYFAGEILDVDGRCGGYNLQWAWCSGYLAGYNAAVK